jgi:type I restriction enzyme S subunit
MEEVQLGTLTNRKIGYGIVQPGNSVKNGVPVIKVNNIISGLRNIGDLETTSVENDRKYSRTKLLGGELIISVVGTIGKTAIVPKEFKGCNLVRATALIDIVDSQLALWVKYYIDSPKGQVYIKGNLNTTVQPTLNVKSLVEMPIPLFTSKYRSKVVNILKSIDDKIECNRRINENLEQQAQALFKSWFLDFEPFKDQPFVESELGMIPQGWKVGTLEEVGDIVGGSTPSKSKPEYYTEEGIAWLTPKDLSISKDKFTSRGEIDITELGYKSCSAKLMPKGTVLFSSRAPIGYISIAKNEICTNQGFKSVVPKVAGTAFIYYFLKISTPEIENKATGSTFKEASGSLMKSLPIIIPPSPVFNQFEEIIKPYFTKQEIIEDESRRLAELRDTLLPKLMSGEIDVNDIKI